MPEGGGAIPATLEGNGWAVGFSPTTGGCVFGDLLAQPLTVSSGSSKASKTALFLGSVGIGYLLLIAGVDLALAESGAGVIQRNAVALPVLVCAIALLVRQCCARGVAVVQGLDQLESDNAQCYK